MPDTPPLSIVVLAAGKGTRMKSPRAKVLHEVFFRPMLHHVLDSVLPLEPRLIVVIVGHQQDEVAAILGDYPVVCCAQPEQRGTGDAVRCARPLLEDCAGEVMILCGDSPLLLAAHLRQMHEAHRRSGAALTIMTTEVEDPTGYGRVISAADGTVRGIVEEKDATGAERAIREINAGIYLTEASFLFRALARVTADNAQQELYLTDIVGIGVGDGARVNRFVHPCPAHVLGVNSRAELALAQRELSNRRNQELMARGITMHDPLTTTIAPAIPVGAGCVFAAPVTVVGRSAIGSDCVLGPGVYLEDAVLGDGVWVGANSVIVGETLADHAVIAPLTLRSGRRP